MSEGLGGAVETPLVEPLPPRVGGGAAYERRSVIVTSNLHPSGFDSIMPKTLATAALDRLLHHAPASS